MDRGGQGNHPLAPSPWVCAPRTPAQRPEGLVAQPLRSLLAVVPVAKGSGPRHQAVPNRRRVNVWSWPAVAGSPASGRLRSGLREGSFWKALRWRRRHAAGLVAARSRKSGPLPIQAAALLAPDRVNEVGFGRDGPESRPCSSRPRSDHRCNRGKVGS